MAKIGYSSYGFATRPLNIDHHIMQQTVVDGMLGKRCNYNPYIFIGTINAAG